MPTTAAIVSAVAGAASVNQSYEAKNTAKREKKRNEEKQEANMAAEQRDKFAAKKQQFDTSRQITRRGQSRGRASTILDKSDNLG